MAHTQSGVDGGCGSEMPRAPLAPAAPSSKIEHVHTQDRRTGEHVTISGRESGRANHLDLYRACGESDNAVHRLGSQHDLPAKLPDRRLDVPSAHSAYRKTECQPSGALRSAADFPRCRNFTAAQATSCQG